MKQRREFYSAEGYAAFITPLPPAAPPSLPTGFPIQARLTVNQEGDVYEQEADRVAALVMRMPSDDKQGRATPAPMQVQTARSADDGPVAVRVGPAGLLGAEPGCRRAGHPVVEEVAGLGTRQRRRSFWLFSWLRNVQRAPGFARGEIRRTIGNDDGLVSEELGRGEVLGTYSNKGSV